MQCKLICERFDFFFVFTATHTFFYSFTTSFSFFNYFLNSTEPATFVEKLEQSQLFKKGDAVQLECKVAGTPTISITWFKNDKEIKESDACSMSFLNSIAALRIYSISLEDVGEYLCQAKNEAGTDTCSCAVIVKGVLKSLLLLYSSFIYSYLFLKHFIY